MTEKGTRLREQENKYFFAVHRDATRRDIKRAVESLYKVNVASINTMVMRGKVKRLGRAMAKRPNWKKAIVTLKQGETIDFLQEV